MLEYVSGGSVGDLMSEFGALSEEVIVQYVKQLLSALQYLHANNIVHGDIKCANILMTSTGVVKLADFGCSKVLPTPSGATSASSSPSSSSPSSPSSSPYGRGVRSPVQCCGLVGTVPFMAPEVIRQSGFDEKADVWSLGCAIVEMATGGVAPWVDFAGGNTRTAMYEVASSGRHACIPQHVSAGCAAFLSRCFRKDASERASATELLSDAWLCS